MQSSEASTAKEPPKPATPQVSQPQASGKGGAAQSTKPQEAAPAPDTKKASGAELKKQAKAEKAARRAQALQEKQGGPAASSPAPPGPGQKVEGQKGPKGQHKRVGSMAGDARNLPVRGGPQRAAAPAVEVPKEEDKTVEFFRHLYKTRTTSIAGAGKDVHPAVLALGLQMSNYTICGSCARLVATLQAFKSVSFPITGPLNDSISLLSLSRSFSLRNGC
jgi:translation initiation factor eIF-2B subunit delta